MAESGHTAKRGTGRKTEDSSIPTTLLSGDGPNVEADVVAQQTHYIHWFTLLFSRGSWCSFSPWPSYMALRTFHSTSVLFFSFPSSFHSFSASVTPPLFSHWVPEIEERSRSKKTKRRRSRVRDTQRECFHLLFFFFFFFFFFSLSYLSSLFLYPLTSSEHKNSWGAMPKQLHTDWELL